tara:strand:- start:684 stop:1331 length:648 start_codon:yes stop_codon:yes gene_type:complete
MRRPVITKLGLRLHKGFANKFKEDVIKELKRKVKLAGVVIAKNSENAIRILLRTRLSASPTVQSLVGGELRGHFGLVDGDVRISNIIDLWCNALNVTFFPAMGKMGGIVVVLDESFIESVINMPVASFVTEKGTHLEWLRWLLLEGSAPIVGEYVFKSGTSGRTGQGVMVKKRGRSWSVPPQFQGIEGNNFVTRALEGVETEVQAVIRREFIKVL